MTTYKIDLIFDTAKEGHADDFLLLGSRLKTLKPTPLVSPPEAREAFFQDHGENGLNGSTIQPPSDTAWVLLTFNESPENQGLNTIYRLLGLDDYEFKKA